MYLYVLAPFAFISFRSWMLGLFANFTKLIKTIRGPRDRFANFLRKNTQFKALTYTFHQYLVSLLRAKALCVDSHHIISYLHPPTTSLIIQYVVSGSTRDLNPNTWMSEFSATTMNWSKIGSVHTFYILFCTETIQFVHSIGSDDFLVKKTISCAHRQWN